jgi:hypothetical protein
MEGLTEGRIVSFVVDSETHRAAIVVRDWKTPDGIVNLQVFWDGQNDTHLTFDHGDGDDPTRVSLVPYGEDTTVAGTWHWIV